MKEGIYRLYRLYTDDNGRTQRRMVGRFLFYGEEFVILEDHDGVLESLSPNGHVDDNVLARLKNMSQSAYWQLVHEDDIQAGEHEHLLPEVNDTGPGAWPAPKE